MKKKALAVALLLSGTLAFHGQAFADEYSNGTIQGEALPNVVHGVNQQASGTPKAPWQDASLTQAANNGSTVSNSTASNGTASKLLREQYPGRYYKQCSFKCAKR